MTAMSAGMVTSVRYRPFPRKRPISRVPTKPATPMTSNARDTVATSARVTVSKNGRM